MSDDALIEAMVWAAIDSRKLPEGTLVNYTTFKADMTAALAALRKTHSVVPRRPNTAILDTLHDDCDVAADRYRAMLNASEATDA